MTYTFKWGKKAVSGKSDPYHTISNLEQDAFLDGWLRSFRADCPWQLIETETGKIIRSGLGSRENGVHRVSHLV